MLWPGPGTLAWPHTRPHAYRGHITCSTLQMGKLRLGGGGVQGLAAGVVKSSNSGAKRAPDLGHPPGLTCLTELCPLAPRSRELGRDSGCPFPSERSSEGPLHLAAGEFPAHPSCRGRGSTHFLFLLCHPGGSAQLGPPAAPSGPGLPAPSSCLHFAPSSPHPPPTQWRAIPSPHPTYWGRMPAQLPLAPGSCSQPWPVDTWPGPGRTLPWTGQSTECGFQKAVE